MLRKRLELLQSRQYSLATLLLAPLIFAPLLVSLREAVKLEGGSSPDWEVGDVGIVALGFAFAIAHTFISYRRRLAAGTFRTDRPFCWCLLHGAFYGVVFYALLFGPVIFAMARNSGQVLRTVGFFAQVLAIPSPIVGAAAGGILGLFLSGGEFKRG